jgi:hypothetical protein
LVSNRYEALILFQQLLLKDLEDIFFKENKSFCYYSRGSLMESKIWLTKAFERKLISEDEFIKQNSVLSEIHQKLNAYIKSIGRSESLATKSMTNDQ